MHDASVSRLSLIRRLSFCAGHRLFGHEGRCAFLHGHNYRVEVEVEAQGGGTEVDEIGRVVDFAVIKQRLLGWLDEHWDHACILWEEDAVALAAVRQIEPTKFFRLPWNPTAENMARYLLEVVAPRVLGELGVVARRVTLWETDESCAIAARTGDGGEGVFAVDSAAAVDGRP